MKIEPERIYEDFFERHGDLLGKEVDRRAFLKRAGRWSGGLLLGACLGSLASCARKTGETVRKVTRTAPPIAEESTGAADLAIATGKKPGELARRAVEAVGGMGRFVRSGDLVVVKVNASFLDGRKNATTTDPEVAGQVVAMCREAGAGRVLVMDHVLCGSVQDGFGASSGIGEAVEANGGEVLGFGAGDKGHGVKAEIPGARAMRYTEIYPEVLDADVVITVPKAKHHSGTGLSLGMKNFIGVTADMGKIHRYDTHRAIADLNALVRPSLSVIDATVILLENGPGGPGPTREAGQVIASPDVVAADSYACTLFGLAAADVPHIVHGSEAGLGQVDYSRLKTARV